MRFLEALQEWLVVKVVAPVAEVRTDDDEGTRLAEDLFENFAVLRHHFVWHLSDHHRQQDNVLARV